MRKKVKKWLNIMISFCEQSIFRLVPDALYLKCQYRLYTREKLNLKNPKSFNEKIQFLKLHDRNEIYTDWVDKVKAKKLAANIIGEEYIVQTIGCWNSFEEIDFSEMPNQFVLKCTHDSGGVIICKDKEKFNYCEAKKELNRHLERNYYWHGREWPYKNVNPAIIAEPLLTNSDKSDIIDYKLLCFNGVVKYIFTCTERFSDSGLKVTWFDDEWNKMPFERHYPQSEVEIERPINFDLMKKLAGRLSHGIPFVRVDFYEIDEKIYFGELTFYPGSGLEEFNPKEWGDKLGALIDVDNI